MMLEENNNYPSKLPLESPKTEEYIELEDLAKQIRADNERKMAALQTALHPPLPTPPPDEATDLPPPQEDAVDAASQLGKFGWHETEGDYIPYLTREPDAMKLVSKRMAEVKLLAGLEAFFSRELLSCMHIQLLPATEAEAALLDDVNLNHSDGCYGVVPFTKGDSLILLDDLVEMVSFLRYCCAKLVSEPQMAPNLEPCGFILIGQETVPYVLIDTKKYLPLFYFDGEVQPLRERAVQISGWKFAYIRLMCKVQGVRREFFEGRSIDCVELAHLEEFFPQETEFRETGWPAVCMLDYRASPAVVPRASTAMEPPKSAPISTYSSQRPPPKTYAPRRTSAVGSSNMSAPIQQFNPSNAPVQQLNSSSVQTDQFNQSSAPVQQFNSPYAPIGQFNPPPALMQQFNTSSAPPRQYNSLPVPDQQFNFASAPVQQLTNPPSAPQQLTNPPSSPVQQLNNPLFPPVQQLNNPLFPPVQQLNNPLAGPSRQMNNSLSASVQPFNSSAPNRQFNSSAPNRQLNLSAPNRQFNLSAPNRQLNTPSAPVRQFISSTAPMRRFHPSAAPNQQVTSSAAPVQPFNRSAAPVPQFNSSSASAPRFNPSSANVAPRTSPNTASSIGYTNAYPQSANTSVGQYQLDPPGGPSSIQQSNPRLSSLIDASRVSPGKASVANQGQFNQPLRSLDSAWPAYNSQRVSPHGQNLPSAPLTSLDGLSNPRLPFGLQSAPNASQMAIATPQVSPQSTSRLIQSHPYHNAPGSTPRKTLSRRASLNSNILQSALNLQRPQPSHSVIQSPTTLTSNQNSSRPSPPAYPSAVNRGSWATPAPSEQNSELRRLMSFRKSPV